MESLNTWILPFTFIPGVGMLVLSTANRYFHVKNRVYQFHAEKGKGVGEEVERLLNRARLFHRALTSLYIAIGCFSLAALLGNLHQNWFAEFGTACILASDFLIFSGVLFVVYSAVCLIQESALSLRNTEELIARRD